MRGGSALRAVSAGPAPGGAGSAGVGAEPPPVARAPGAAPGRDPLGNQRAPLGDFSARSVTRIQGRTEFFLLPAFVLVGSVSLSTFIAPSPGGARGSPAALCAASVGLWEVPLELFTELLQPPWNTEGWLQVGSGSFQRLLFSARFFPAKLCLRGADTLYAFATLGPGGGLRAALLSPLPVRSLVLPGAAGRSPAGRAFFRAGVPWCSPASLLTQAPLPGGSSRMGNISCGSGVNSRT